MNVTRLLPGHREAITPRPTAPIQGEVSVWLPAWEPGGRSLTACGSHHSRIEWVWLHWREYLLARGEFYRWFQKMVVTLEPPAELQLGLKEKQWQLSDAQVLLHNVTNQAELLDRLLEEAASLFNRIGDPSVDEDAQKRMKTEYDMVKAKAQVRLGPPLHPPCIYLPHLLIHQAISSPFHYPPTCHPFYSPTHLSSIQLFVHLPSHHPSIHPPSSIHPPTIHRPSIHHPPS